MKQNGFETWSTAHFYLFNDLVTVKKMAWFDTNTRPFEWVGHLQEPPSSMNRTDKNRHVHNIS